MAGPVMALQYFLIFSYFLLLAFLFVRAIKNRHSFRKSARFGILFLLLTSLAIYVYYKNNNAEYEASKTFLGDYKLNKLDRNNCDSCIVRLYKSYTYDIIKNGNKLGEGKWHIETASDIPGYFLKVENGPNWVVWEHDRLIEYIDRTQRK